MFQVSFLSTDITYLRCFYRSNLDWIIIFLSKSNSVCISLLEYNVFIVYERDGEERNNSGPL